VLNISSFHFDLSTVIGTVPAVRAASLKVHRRNAKKPSMPLVKESLSALVGRGSVPFMPASQAPPAQLSCSVCFLTIGLYSSGAWNFRDRLSIMKLPYSEFHCSSEVTW